MVVVGVVVGLVVGCGCVVVALSLFLSLPSDIIDDGVRRQRKLLSENL